MDLPLVVGVEGSEAGLRAVDWAADEAALRQLPLRLVHASLWERYEGTALAEDAAKPSEQVMAEDIVEAAVRRARARRLEVTVSAQVLPEEPGDALVRESQYASALVLGSRGRSGFVELLVGSVSRTVAARALCPVIVLRDGHDDTSAPGAPGHVVLGVGEHPEGSAAVRFALVEAARRRVPLEAVHAWRSPGHGRSGRTPAGTHGEQAARMLDEALHDAPAELELHWRTVEGSVRKVLLDASHHAGLLVVGERHRHHRFGPQLGPIAHTLLHHSACPVAVVPEAVHEPAADQEQSQEQEQEREREREQGQDR